MKKSLVQTLDIFLHIKDDWRLYVYFERWVEESIPNELDLNLKISLIINVDLFFMVQKGIDAKLLLAY